jgi:hypothetical protein
MDDERKRKLFNPAEKVPAPEPRQSSTDWDCALQRVYDYHMDESSWKANLTKSIFFGRIRQSRMKLFRSLFVFSFYYCIMLLIGRL